MCVCVCVFSQIKDTSKGILVLSPGSCPKGGTGGRLDAQGVEKYFFVAGHVTLYKYNKLERVLVEKCDYQPRRSRG